MKYQIVGKNITITEGISSAIKTKLSKLDKFFNEKDADCRVVASSYGDSAKIEVTIYLKDFTLRGEVENEDLYAAIDLCLDKLIGQIHKIKTKIQKNQSKLSLGQNFVDDKEDDEDDLGDDIIVRSKSYFLKPMSIDEAILRMEALGHDFFMYLDQDDERVSIVYIRKDGGYGVIQAENPLK